MDLTDRRARICEVLPHLVAGGSYQMAFDMELLARAAERGDRAVIRTYEWSAFPQEPYGPFMLHLANLTEI